MHLYFNVTENFLATKLFRKKIGFRAKVFFWKKSFWSVASGKKQIVWKVLTVLQPKFFTNVSKKSEKDSNQTILGKKISSRWEKLFLEKMFIFVEIVRIWIFFQKSSSIVIPGFFFLVAVSREIFSHPWFHFSKKGTNLF